MTAAVAEPPLAPPAPPQGSAPRLRYRLSVPQYERMIAAGVFGPDDRLELLDGELVAKMPIGALHAACVLFLNKRLQRLLGERADVSVQSPLRLSGSRPEPDVAVVRPRADCYARQAPGADDCHLVVEVSDTSAEFDLGAKAALYAAAGLPEYWVVDLAGQAVAVHRGPTAVGGWTTRTLARPGESVAPLAFPDVALGVADILLRDAVAE